MNRLISDAVDQNLSAKIIPRISNGQLLSFDAAPAHVAQRLKDEVLFQKFPMRF